MDKNVAGRRKAQQLARDGQLDHAIEEMERVLQSGETDPYDFVFHGDLLARRLRLEEAVSVYEEAVAAYDRVGLYRNAIAICKKILRSEPGRIRAYGRLGDLYAKEGLLGDAVIHYLSFLDRAGDEVTSQEFLETLDRVSQMGGQNTEVTLRLADLYVRAGHEERAVQMLGEVADKATAGGGYDVAMTLRERAQALLRRTAEAPADDGAHPPGPDGNGKEPAAQQEEPPAATEFVMTAGAEEETEAEAEPEAETPVAAPAEPPIETPAAPSPPEPAPHAPEPASGNDSGAEIAAARQAEFSPAQASAQEPAAAAAAAPAPGTSGPIAEAMAAGDWERARDLCVAQLEESPEDMPTVENLVVVSRRLGDTLAAVRYLMLLGDLKINEEDLEGSLGCFVQVLELDPENATARRRLSRFREMHVPGVDRVAEECKSSIQGVLETDGSSVTVRENGGLETEEWIDLKALLTEFRDGVRAQVRPDDFSGHYDLGLSHFKMELHEEAMEEFDAVLATPDLPKDVELKAREMRGACLQELNRQAEAIREYEAALAVPGRSPDEQIMVRYRLARSLEATGEVSRAREIFHAIVEAGGPFLDTIEHLERLGGWH